MNLRAYLILATALVLWACILPRAPAAASVAEAPKVVLRAALSPAQLGASATIYYDVQIRPAAGLRVPPVATKLSLFYPDNIGLAASGLGLATCRRQRLEQRRLGGCPRNSVIGLARAEVAIPIGSQVVHEKARITALSGPMYHGNLGLLFNVIALRPFGAEFVFQGGLLPAGDPYGGRVDVELPLIPVFWTGRYVALERVHGTFGPDRVMYVKRIGRRTVTYKPAGFLLPDACPRGGFRFAAQVTWNGGRRTTARTRVRCPG